MRFTRFPDRRESGVFRDGRSDGGAERLVARDDDGVRVGELLVRAGMDEDDAALRLHLHIDAWREEGPIARPEAVPERSRYRPATGLGAAAGLALAALLVPGSPGQADPEHGVATVERFDGGFVVGYEAPGRMEGSPVMLRGYIRDRSSNLYDFEPLGTPLTAPLPPEGPTTVILPPGTSYAGFWFESPDGERDLNGGALWHVTDDSFEGERDRLRLIEYMAGDSVLLWRYAADEAGKLVGKWPDEPEAWFFFAVDHEQGYPDRDVRALLATQLERLDRLYSGRQASADVVAAMGGLADHLGERTIASRWYAELADRFPESRALWGRVMVQAWSRGPSALIATADSIEALHGPLPAELDALRAAARER